MRRYFDGEGCDDGAVGDAAVTRRDQRHVVAEPRERFRQRRRNISEPSRFRVRLGFGCNHENAQARFRLGAIGFRQCRRGRSLSHVSSLLPRALKAARRQSIAV